jgi:hypothetical protein
MKFLNSKKFLALALALANGFYAAAQSNGGSPDYASFSRVITERNIFDPNRYSHTRGTTRISRPRNHSTVNSAPAFSLVGTMSYEKGRFAFFSGNNEDLKKILVLDGSIAGYTVTEIMPAQVTLQTGDKKNLTLKIGDLMRQESGHWELAGQGEVPAGTSATEPTAPAAGESSPAAETPSALAGGNSAAAEILKRLMQKREQESK